MNIKVDKKTLKTYLNKSEKLPDLTENRNKGHVGLALLLGIASTPVCAYVGSYIGEGLGYVWGNIIDFIPLINDIAPWLAERTGLINNAKEAIDLNENLYQTTGAIGGFWGGLYLPFRLIISVYSDD